MSALPGTFSSALQKGVRGERRGGKFRTHRAAHKNPRCPIKKVHTLSWRTVLSCEGYEIRTAGRSILSETEKMRAFVLRLGVMLIFLPDNASSLSDAA